LMVVVLLQLVVVLLLVLTPSIGLLERSRTLRAACIGAICMPMGGVREAGGSRRGAVGFCSRTFAGREWRSTRDVLVLTLKANVSTSTRTNLVSPTL
jgi:hypothetical protein